MKVNTGLTAILLILLSCLDLSNAISVIPFLSVAICGSRRIVSLRVVMIAFAAR